MQERINDELVIIRQWFPDAEYHEEGYWIRIPFYSLPEGWNRSSTEVVFQVPVGYPGTPPYGIYVQAGLQFQNSQPDNYVEPASNHPPFSGTWGIFSWSPESGWRPTAELRKGSNLLNWVLGFADRFHEGK